MILIPPETVYMIRHKFRSPFFLYDYIEYPELALWTRIRHKAREFYSEESVEMYMYINLSNRPCEIVMIK